MERDSVHGVGESESLLGKVLDNAGSGAGGAAARKIRGKDVCRKWRRTMYRGTESGAGHCTVVQEVAPDNVP